MSHAIVNRRDFLKTGAAAGATLVIGLYLPAFDPRGSHAPVARELFKPNAWIEIRPDGAVTIWTGRSEMDRKSTRLNSSHSQISYAVFCLKKKNRCAY